MSLQKFFDFTGRASVILLPTFLLVVDDVGGLIFLITLACGCAYLFVPRKNNFELSSQNIVFFISLSLLAISVLISAAVNGVEATKLDRLILPLLAVPIYYLYRNNPVSENLLWIGLVSGAVVAGLTAIYQMLWLDSYHRAGGTTNPIMFGDISLVMGFMAMAGSGWFLNQGRWMKALPFLGLLFGLLASVLSLSRGGWLALPVAIVIFFWVSAKHISLLKSLSVVVLVSVSLVAIYHTPQFKFKDRIEITFTDFKNYIESEDVNDPVRATGLGIRLDMWKISVQIFNKNPVFGVGWGSYEPLAKEYVAKGFAQEKAALFPHPHNQYLSAMVKGGLFGLAAVLIFMGIPLVMFFRRLVAGAVSARERRIALAGLVFISSFLVFGLTEAVFERSRMMIFIAFYLAVLMALSDAAREPQSQN